MSRHLRTEILLGPEKINKLKQAKVTVVGLGAVGSYAVEALARAGVGNLRLVDFDKVDRTNINRQLYALESTIGLSKATIAKQRVLDIAPDINVEVFDMFLNNETKDLILNNNPDVVIDAIDSLNTKVQFLSELYDRGIPVVSSMGAALKTDPSKIKVDDISKTKNCHLARFVRKRLKRQEIIEGIKCVYSTELTGTESIIISDKVFLPGRGRKRNTMGSLPTITGIFGLIAANTVLDMICDGFKK